LAVYSESQSVLAPPLFSYTGGFGEFGEKLVTV